jgi:ferredoxin
MQTANTTEAITLPGDPHRPSFPACTGCGVCVLPCPVWRETRDVMLTLYGRAMALQRGATAEDLSESLMACVLCGACEATCPEDIDTVGMTLDLRERLAASHHSPLAELAKERMAVFAPPHGQPRSDQATRLLLPGPALRANDPLLRRVISLLEPGEKFAVATDDGSDIAVAREAGLPVSAQRRADFDHSIQGAKEIIATEGLLHAMIRTWLPDVKVIGLGEALLRLPAVRLALRHTDLLVVETRAYHADFARLVLFYDQLRKDIDCEINLDLQRAAIPTGAAGLQTRLGAETIDTDDQAGWVIHGRRINRIVVECLRDREPFERITDLPVVHVADLPSAGGGR